jgi:two-component system, cell cycle sensor histidine kinase and response regulator CckA
MQWEAIVQGARSLIFCTDLDGRILAASRPDPSGVTGPGKCVFELLPDESRDAAAAALRRLQRTGQPVVFEDCGNSGAYRYRLEMSLLGTDEPTRVVVLASDVSAERRAQQQNQRMESMARLAGDFATEFNRMLTVIKSCAYFAHQRLHGNHRARDGIDGVVAATDRASRLIRELLAFSRRQPAAARVVDLNDTIAELDAMLRWGSSDVELITIPGEGVPSVEIDRNHVETLLLNLVENAHEAMRSGGTLTITTSKETVSSERLPNVAPGEYAVLTVSDTGEGMAEDTKARAFDPFFSTKRNGTGLGLSTCHGIVKQAGGEIVILSSVGRGTTAKVYLPATSRRPPQSRAHSAPVVGGTETVLVVEDEPIVRKLVVSVLRESGYHVLEAENGDTALMVADQHQRAIDLVVTDVVMPGTNGEVVARQLSSRYPHTKILFVSGVFAEPDGLSPGVAFLEKPFTPASLTQKVRRLLDA